MVTDDGTRKYFILVPLTLEPAPKFMLIAGLPEDSNYLEDAYGKVISSFYANYLQLLDEPEMVEAAIIDDLKRGL